MVDAQSVVDAIVEKLQKDNVLEEATETGSASGELSFRVTYKVNVEIDLD